jgi:hypothetical protein
MTIWNNLPPFGIFYGRLVLFVVIWYIFPILVCLDQEKSGNHAPFTADQDAICHLSDFETIFPL